MEKMAKPVYLTATSLTARQINRRIIRNIIYRQQPISRADTARETGLQRSTVSLIVDELINEGWVVEGEHVRIPRGRRPIYLQINSDQAGLYAVHIGRDHVELAVANLGGDIDWTGKEKFAEFSAENLAGALRSLYKTASESHSLQMKGVGVALDNLAGEENVVSAVLEDIFDMPVAMDSVAVASGKWFLLSHKDSKLAKNHLVSINIDSGTTLGVLVNGHPLRGAHLQAGAMLTDESPVLHPKENGHPKAAPELIDELAKRMQFSVAAYDPGLILLTGSLANSSEPVEKLLEDRLRAAGATDTAVRVLETGGDKHNIYLNGAIALILSHFLDECP